MMDLWNIINDDGDEITNVEKICNLHTFLTQLTIKCNQQHIKMTFFR